MLQGNRFSLNNDLIEETEGYFGDLNKSFHKEDFEVLEKRCTDCITVNEDFAKKKIFFDTPVSPY